MPPFQKVISSYSFDKGRIYTCWEYVYGRQDNEEDSDTEDQDPSAPVFQQYTAMAQQMIAFAMKTPAKLARYGLSLEAFEDIKLQVYTVQE